MARKYAFGTNRFAWNLNRCEEILIITAYNEIARFVPPDLEWLHEFEHIFYDAGKGIGFHLLAAINEVRKRKRLKPLVLRETDIGPNERRLDSTLRAKERRRLRDELATLSPPKRAEAVEEATEQAASLPPPHFTWDQYRARQDWIDDDRHTLTQEEISRRLNAVASTAAAAPPVKPAREAADARFIKMLTLASDPALHEEIISALEPDAALDLAERVEDPALRNALVRRSISLVTRRAKAA
jgi:hypothetical protein